MNIILNIPINITLTSGFLVQESEGVGTVHFQVNEQQCTLALTSSDYVFDTPFSVGDRVRLKESFGSLGINSEGELQEIIIDPTQDKADVLFDKILPNQIFVTEEIVSVETGDVSVLIRVPLSVLDII